MRNVILKKTKIFLTVEWVCQNYDSFFPWRKALFEFVPGKKSSKIGDGHLVDDHLNRIAAYLGKGEVVCIA